VDGYSPGQMTVVAISAAYGTRSGQIGPKLAERLGVPFVDRAIAFRVAGRLDVSVDEAVKHWEPAPRSFVERMVSAFLGADTVAPVGPPPDMVTPEDFRQATERVVLEQAATGEGVILGRGGVAVLHDDPAVLRVRLSGPADRRLKQAVHASGLSESEARDTMNHLDRYHAEYLKQFYGADIDDPTMYHLTIDATALDNDACVSLMVVAAHALGA
jgi:Cytidylate kinase-like family